YRTMDSAECCRLFPIFARAFVPSGFCRSGFSKSNRDKGTEKARAKTNSRARAKANSRARVKANSRARNEIRTENKTRAKTATTLDGWRSGCLCQTQSEEKGSHKIGI